MCSVVMIMIIFNVCVCYGFIVNFLIVDKKGF